MQFTQAIAAAVLAVAASATSAAPNATWVTLSVTEYITDCPTPTVFTQGKVTYTATESTKVTVSCPTTCTVSYKATATPIAPGNRTVPSYNGTVYVPHKNGTTGSGATYKPTAGTGSAKPTSGSGSGSNTGSNTGSNSPKIANSGNAATVGGSLAIIGLAGLAFAL